MSIVVSLGGSFIFENVEGLKELRDLVKDIDQTSIIITGGGRLARDHIDFAKGLGLNEEDLHSVGISVTSTNALMISRLLDGFLYTGDPRTMPKEKLVVSGGYKPGWTTDTCAAYAAEACRAEVIFNISRENGVYDKDPRTNKDAKLLKKLTFHKLMDLTAGERKPGMNFIFDPQAARICEAAGIQIVVTNHVSDILAYKKGKELFGSIIF